MTPLPPILPLCICVNEVEVLDSLIIQWLGRAKNECSIFNYLTYRNDGENGENMENTKKELSIEELLHISKDLNNMYDVHTEGYEFELLLGNFNMKIDLENQGEEIGLISIDGLNVIFISLVNINRIYQQYDHDTEAIFFEFNDDKHMLLRKIPQDQASEIIKEQYNIDMYKAKKRNHKI